MIVIRVHINYGQAH